MFKNLLIQKALNIAFWSFLEFGVAGFKFGHLIEGREHTVDMLAVAWQLVDEFLAGESVSLKRVVGGVYQADELVTTLNHHALVNQRVRHELLLNFLRINILSVGTKQHVLLTNFSSISSG